MRPPLAPFAGRHALGDRRAAAEVTLVFDGYCGFCTRCVDWLTRLDRRRRVRPVAFQLPGVPERYGLTAAECAAAAWAVDADGTLHRGAGAANAALSAALGTTLPLRLYGVGPVGRLQDRAYAWVARNRRHLPGIAPWCRSHPAAGCTDSPDAPPDLLP